VVVGWWAGFHFRKKKRKKGRKCGQKMQTQKSCPPVVKDNGLTLWPCVQTRSSYLCSPPCETAFNILCESPEGTLGRTKLQDIFLPLQNAHKERQGDVENNSSKGSRAGYRRIILCALRNKNNEGDSAQCAIAFSPLFLE
jgi:hypothetical protein